MPVFTIETPGGRKVKLEAPDQATAIRGAKEWEAGQAKTKAPAGPPRRGGLIEGATGFLANANRGLGIGDELVAGLGTAGGVVDALRTGVPVSPARIKARFTSEMAKQRGIEDDYMARRPLAANLAKGTGAAATLALPVAPVANAAVRAPTLLNAGRGAVTAGASGGAYSLVDRGTVQERIAAAGKAVVDPATLALGGAVGAVAGRLTQGRGPPKRRVREDAATLLKAGVPLTPGQAQGGVLKATEDALTSVPVMGDAIARRRTEGAHGYNRAKANSALAHIGETLPDDVAAGTAAVKHAGDKLSAAYKTVLPEVGVTADDAFGADLRKISPIIETMTEANRKRLAGIIDQRVMARFDTDGQALTGEMFKRVDSELEKEAARYSRSDDPDHQAMGEAIGVVRDALGGAAKRQNPGYAALVDKIDKGWAELTRIEGAATKAVNEGGVYMPSQMTGAMVQGDKRSRVRGRGVARGEALNQDFDVTAQRVLPSRLPDSGTARRAMVGLLLSGGAGATGGVPGLAMSGLAAGAGAALYSRPSMEIYQRILAGRMAKDEQAAAIDALRQQALKSPEAQKLLLNLARRVPGVAAAAGVVAASGASPQ